MLYIFRTFYFRENSRNNISNCIYVDNNTFKCSVLHFTGPAFYSLPQLHLLPIDQLQINKLLSPCRSTHQNHLFSQSLPLWQLQMCMISNFTYFWWRDVQLECWLFLSIQHWRLTKRIQREVQTQWVKWSFSVLLLLTNLLNTSNNFWFYCWTYLSTL